MIDDVFEIGIRQPDVQRVQDRTHTGAGMIGLEVTRAVPHEGTDPIADFDTGVAQSVGELMCTVARLAVGLTLRTPVSVAVTISSFGATLAPRSRMFDISKGVCCMAIA